MKKRINKRQLIILTAILIVFGITITYGYFAGVIGTGASTNVSVTTGSADHLEFIPGADLKLEASQKNFYLGAGNLNSTTTTTAKLTAGQNSTPSMTYNAFFVIDNNTYDYTTNDKKAEIIMNVYDPTGAEVTAIPGIHYVTSGGVTGFDITKSYGSFQIAKDYVITTSSVITQDWQVKVTFVNLDTNQKANEDKMLTGKIYLTKETMDVYTLPVVNTLSVTNNDGISLGVNAATTKGTTDVSKYFFAIEENSTPVGFVDLNNNKLVPLSSTTVTYTESTNPAYSFTNLKPETKYTMYSYTVDTNGFTSPTYQTDITTNKYNYASITTVSSNNLTETSFDLTVTAKAGQAGISKYYYSIDNGKTYSESDTNTYSASSLTPGTQYFVKVYVKDTNGYSSPVYDLIVKTNYTNPVVNSVTTSNITQTSITVNVNTTKGTNNIATYYYSIDNGVTYKSSASSSYTFSSLTQGTTYNIKVYVKDSLSYQSNIYSVSATTLKPTFA
jgi:hypothetical protein